MPLNVGARLGPYEIVGLVGAGGMGEVYRARDPRLGRDVAIKVLPAALSSDPERLQRFEQEARAAAALNHPNILAVYDIGQERLRPAREASLRDAEGEASGSPEPGALGVGPRRSEVGGVPANIEEVGSPYIVSELLEGETLRERLQQASAASRGAGVPAFDQGPLPVRKAVEYAVQIAHGLAAAHEKGITHRDLKPENVFVTTDGRVKILDFGLAKLTEAGGGSGAANSMLPTVAPATLPGVVLGTVGYMAPEQVRGLQVDHRSDIFAFGAMLFEMLTGRRAFRGDTAIDTVTAILKEDPPDLSAAEPQVPPALARIVHRCLEKSPAARFQSTRDFAFALEGLSSQSERTEVSAVGAVLPAALARPSRERIAWTLVAVLLVTSVAALILGRSGYWQRSAMTEAPEMRLQVDTPGGGLVGFAISPDGRSVVFRATTGGTSQLWLRRLDTETARPLPGTDGANSPFWSPDSLSIGFFAGGQLKRLDIAVGAVRTLTNLRTGLTGGTWSRDGVILFTQSQASPISRVPASGGEAVDVSRLDPPRQTGHRLPSFSPDGRHFLFFSLGTAEGRGVYLGSLETTETRRLFDADSAAVFSGPDLVLFSRQGVLVAQRLNPSTFVPIGDPVPMAASVAIDPGTQASVALSASATGLVAYRAGAGERRFAWVDRSGRQVALVGEPDRAQPNIRRFYLSPDGRTVAMSRTVSGNTDVWLMDTERGGLRRLTTDPAVEFTGAGWSPDGTRFIFDSTRGGVLDLYERSVTGTGGETLLFASSEPKNSLDWTPDGRFVLYASQTANAQRDLWVLPLFGDKKPQMVVGTPFEEHQGRFSPDGRWIAYQSNEGGRTEIWVQPFPGPGAKSQISNGGGVEPQWRRDGRELFYTAPDNRLMAVPLTLGDDTVAAGQPVALFSATLSPLGGAVNQYLASPDGQRFLVDTMVEEASPITILQNWKGTAPRAQ